MKEFYKHIIIHADVIVKTETKKEAQEIYEAAELLPSRKDIRFSGVVVDEETTNWRILK